MVLISTLDQYQFASYTDYDSKGLEQRFINNDSKNTVKTNDIIKKNIWTKMNMKLSRLLSSFLIQKE